MNARRIDVLISSTGEVTVQTHGFAGPTCQQASHFLEQALGQTLQDRKTADFYLPADATEQVRQER